MKQQEPARIFHLIKSLGRGGAEVLLAEGLRHADRERFTYGYGYFLPWKDAVVPALEKEGAEVVCFGARSSPAVLLSAWKVARFLKTWNADLMHCHLPISGVTGRLAGRMAGVPVVYTEHIDMEQYSLPTRWANLATWPLQERVVAVSEEAAASARRHAGERVPVEVVLNGVDTEVFDPAEQSGQAVRAEWGIPSEAPLVGTIAVFRPQKRLHDWLEAAARIRRAVPEARFLIVGEGPLREELEAKKGALGLDEAVTFAGFQEDVKPYLAALDVYLMSSEREGLPIALLEAMSMGCPVTSTAVGGIPGVVREGEDGFLVEMGDAEALAQAALKLVKDAGRRQEMGRSARRQIQENFSMERMARQLEALYTDVLTRASVHA